MLTVETERDTYALTDKQVSNSYGDTIAYLYHDTDTLYINFESVTLPEYSYEADIANNHLLFAIVKIWESRA